MLHKQGSFIQVFEGDEAAVRSLHAVIRVDARYNHVFTLLALHVAERQFPDWSMGFENLDGIDITGLSGFVPPKAFGTAEDELSWQASVVMGLLTTFAREN